MSHNTILELLWWLCYCSFIIQCQLMRPRHQTESIGACWADPSPGPMLALDPQNAERQSVKTYYVHEIFLLSVPFHFQFIKEEVKKKTDFSKVFTRRIAGQVEWISNTSTGNYAFAKNHNPQPKTETTICWSMVIWKTNWRKNEFWWLTYFPYSLVTYFTYI